MFVKVCGLSTESDVATAVTSGADAVGFVLTDSPRRISPEQAGRLCEAAGAALTVAVFRGESMNVIIETARTAGVQAVQPHGHYPPVELRRALDAGLTVIRAAGIEGNDPLTCAAHGEDLLLVDSAVPGSGLPWDWTTERVRPSGRWLLAGGLRADNIAEAVTALRPWGLDVSSGVERRRGVKDPRLITEFVTVAKSLSTSGCPSPVSDRHRRRLNFFD